MRRAFRRPAAALLVSLLAATTAHAAPFQSGDLAVYRVGTGAVALGQGATAVFVDEFTTAASQTLPVQSITLPTTGSTALTSSGTATSEGNLTLSADRSALALPGYRADVNTGSVATTSTAANARVLGLIGFDGIPNTTTTTTSFSGASIRSVVASSSADIFATGGNTGVVDQPLGGSGTGTIVSSTVMNTRAAAIQGGRLFFSTGSGPTHGIYVVGAGAASGAAGQTSTNIVDTGGTSSPYQFVLADLDPGISFGSTGFDTLYVADDRAGGSGIYKYAYDPGTQLFDFNVDMIALPAARGLTASVAGSTVTLYATYGTSAQNTLASIADTSGYGGIISGSPVGLATAPANTAFRGVALAPVASTAVGFANARARARLHRVVLRWFSGRSEDVIGFSVLRARHNATHRVRISRKLIPAAAISGQERFRVVDGHGRRGDRYFIVGRTTDGQTVTHGPVLAR